MRNFEVILTYKSLKIDHFLSKNVLVNQQKVLEVQLDESHYHTPEEFCDAIINLQERSNVVRMNIIEKNNPTLKPLHWLAENFGRIYFHNGIPLILTRN